MVREDFDTLPGLSSVWYTGKETTNMSATLSEQPGADRDGVVSEDQLIVSQKPEDIQSYCIQTRCCKERGFHSSPSCCCVVCLSYMDAWPQ